MEMDFETLSTGIAYPSVRVKWGKMISIPIRERTYASRAPNDNKLL